jgi:tetratricopeptide (TPR) repeat protein
MNEDKILAVARYLEGDMEADEKAEFEVSLQSDPEVQELVARYKYIHQSLQSRIAPDEQEKAVENTLLGMREQYFKAGSATDEAQSVPDLTSPPVAKQAKTIRLKPYIKWTSIAAVLVIGLLIWAPWSSGLYEKYSFSKQMSVTERGADNQAQLSKAAELFNKGDYAEARKILGKAYMFNPQNPLLTYYFAITLIETKQTYEARTLLQHLYEGQSVFKYDAAFYAALSLVKENKKAEAIQWLQKIPQENANYAKAQSLIAELKK